MTNRRGTPGDTSNKKPAPQRARCALRSETLRRKHPNALNIYRLPRAGVEMQRNTGDNATEREDLSTFARLERPALCGIGKTENRQPAQHSGAISAPRTDARGLFSFFRPICFRKTWKAERAQPACCGAIFWAPPEQSSYPNSFL